MSAGHVGHVNGEYSAACTACRIDGEIVRIAGLAGVTPSPAAIVERHEGVVITYTPGPRRHPAEDVREFVGRVPWPALHRRALAMAAGGWGGHEDV